mgnify:CR=1 FL=1
MTETHTCPLEVMLNVAEKRIRNDSRLSPTAQRRQLGYVSLTKECFEAVREDLVCEGAVYNANQHSVCPLQDATYGARMFAHQLPPGNFTAPLDTVDNGDGGNDDYHSEGVYI